ncbi:nitroreductase [Siminovitchia sp. 179-K 8D1 HS]|uniref:nitroreductase family protein n=1 Tax=Siminovitchia sp. 179-K 8D1 HS TaxID=3142385 RepID=UPI0039A1BE95
MLAVNSIAEIIRERTSIKKGFINKEISREQILSLLEDAVWAPNHGVREPWRFIFISGERKEAFIEEVLTCVEPAKHESTRSKLGEVPAMLVAVVNDDPRQKIREEDVAATSCLLQNFQLLAWEREIGVCWKTPAYIHDPRLRSALGVEPGEKIIGLMQVGYFDKETVAKRSRNRTNPAEKWTDY